MLVYSLAKHVPKIDDDYIYLILLHINNIFIIERRHNGGIIIQ
jgi:hypothetical protein